MAIPILSQLPLPTPLTTTLLVLITTYLGLYHLQRWKKHPCEPPIVPSRIPFIGSLIGLLLHGSAHGKRVAAKNRHHRIFAQPLPGAKRIYTVTDPVLAAAVQRASRSLDFTPLLPDITERVFGLDEETMRVVRRGLGESGMGEKGYLAEIRDLVEGYFSINAASLGTFGREAAEEFAAQLSTRMEELARKEDGEVVDLLAWSRHLVIDGTARATYGPDNPLAGDPSLEDDFWVFAHGIPSLLVGAGPLVGLVPGAGKTLAARERLVKGLREYLEQGKDELGSEIVKKRVEVGTRHGWPGPDAIARQELSFLFAMVINAAVTVFWVVLRVFADGELLKQVRAEIDACIVPGEASGKGKDTARLSLERIKTSTPTLLAVFRECLRTGSDNVSTRIVTANTMLVDEYFLAADSVVQVNGGVIHGDEAIWGADATEFNHTRFLKTAGKSNVHPAAFRGFGGGKTMCPARHFATTEVLAIAAMVVLLFDVEAVDGGEIRVPPKDDSVFPVHILEPKKADRPKVRLRLRKGAVSRGVVIVD